MLNGRLTMLCQVFVVLCVEWLFAYAMV